MASPDSTLLHNFSSYFNHTVIDHLGPIGSENCKCTVLRNGTAFDLEKDFGSGRCFTMLIAQLNVPFEWLRCSVPGGLHISVRYNTFNFRN